VENLDLAAGVKIRLALIGTNALQDQRAVKLNLGGRLFYQSTAAYRKGEIHFFPDPELRRIRLHPMARCYEGDLTPLYKVYNWTRPGLAQDVQFPSYKIGLTYIGPPKD
jgi:hypothetical protein